MAVAVDFKTIADTVAVDRLGTGPEGEIMKTTIALAAIGVALMASSVSAQTRPAFEFRGETTTATVDFTERECRTYSSGSITCSDNSVNIGGVASVSVSQQYYENRLYSVLGLFVGSSYPTMLAAFTMKYGRPTITRPPWQNQVGATIPNEVATWQFRDGTLTLSRMSRTRSYSDFRFRSSAGGPPGPSPTVNF